MGWALRKRMCRDTRLAPGLTFSSRNGVQMCQCAFPDFFAVLFRENLDGSCNVAHTRKKKKPIFPPRNPTSIHVGCHVTNRRTFRRRRPGPPRRSRHTTARPSTARRRRIATYSAAMTEVQRATHPRGTAASPPRVLTRKGASAGDGRHPRDDDERDRPSRVSDGRASPAPPGVRRSRRDLADSAEDLASGAAGSPVKRTREGAPPDDTGPTPASGVRASSSRATEDGGGPSSASNEAPWVARWLAGRETPGGDAPDAHAGDAAGGIPRDGDGDADADHDARRPSPLRRADSGSALTLPSEPAGSEFTTNWFTHNADSLTAVFTQLGWMNDGTRARRVIEIGCWEGRSTQWLLRALCRHADSVVYCVDTWRGGEQYADVGFDLGGEAHAGWAVEARFDANVRLVTGVDPNEVEEEEEDDDENVETKIAKSRRRVNPVRKMKARSLDVLASLLADGRSAGTFDVAYVDGSHAARDVIGDGVMCWELLRRGGVVVFDDYRWDRVMGDAIPPKRCPRMAVDAFLGMFEDELVVLERGYQVVVQKIATRR